MRTIVREAIAETLQMEEVSIKDDIGFSEYGVDSIVAVNLINLINKHFGIILQTTVLFDYNNVDQLTQYIIQEHKSVLISGLQENYSVISETGVEAEDREETEASKKQAYTLWGFGSSARISAETSEAGCLQLIRVFSFSIFGA